MKKLITFFSFAVLVTAMCVMSGCKDDDKDGGDNKSSYSQLVVGKWLMTESRSKATDAWKDATFMVDVMQFDADGKYYNSLYNVQLMEGTYTVKNKKINIKLTKGLMEKQTYEILSMNDTQAEMALYNEGSTEPDAYYRFKRVTDKDFSSDAITSIEFKMTSTSMQKGNKRTFNLVVKPVTVTNPNITYKSSDESVLQVTAADGASVTVEGMKAGEARLTATSSNGKVASLQIKVEGSTEATFETKTFTVGGVTFKMVAVVGGMFTMGAMDGDKDADDNEFPQHKVTLSDYYIGETEVTQALAKAVMGSNPSDHKGDQFPVEDVSWDDCQTFITRLNQLTGLSFRLPTEAEWEYAARGGSKSKGYKFAGSNDVNIVAWYSGNSGYETHAVGTKVKNELGLYDMSGNVWEWCLDRRGYYSSGAQTNPTGPSTGYDRIIRGGSFWSDEEYCRSSCRTSWDPEDSDEYTGFRLAMSK